MTDFPIEGGCGCRAVRYRMLSAPLFVHCCHCRWCQRESGASFALNAMIESDRVTDLGRAPELVCTPSASGLGQTIARCPTCRVALWSHYAGAGPLVKFVRVGTLDDPDLLPPDIHIFTASKQPWVVLPFGTPAVPGYYDRDEYWPEASLARRRAILPQIEARRAATVQAIRPEQEVMTTQRLPYFVGISGRTVHATGLSMHLVVIPPGGRAEPHVHLGYETGIYVLEGSVLTRWGAQLEHEVVSRAGEFLFVPPDVPHEAINLSATGPARAIVARNDPAEQDKVQRYDAPDNAPAEDHP